MSTIASLDLQELSLDELESVSGGGCCCPGAGGSNGSNNKTTNVVVVNVGNGNTVIGVGSIDSKFS